MNTTFLLVNRIKMIVILLNVVRRQVRKNVTKESDGLHNHSTLLTTVRPVKSSTFVAGLGKVT